MISNRRSQIGSGARIRAEESGFTMIIAIGVLFVATLLMVAAFTVANGDIHLSARDAANKQAYYAALAGIQEYEYHLQTNPDYWETCEAPASIVPETATESYKITLLAAASGEEKGLKACSTAKPFESMIESTGSAANTFRIESVGTTGKSSRTIIATFKVTGFLNFIYYTNYEELDPALLGISQPQECEKYQTESRPSTCQNIVFVTGDEVKGPMHTNDSVDICNSPVFGRAGHNPLDIVEFVRGAFTEGNCTNKATFNTATKNYVKGTELPPPSSDASLGSYVESANEFTGVTKLVLNGTTETIAVTNGGKTSTIKWPENGLIWVKSSEGSNSCKYVYSPFESDEAEEEKEEAYCGNVYVSGTYNKSLTIGSDDDVIINGNVYPTSVAGKLSVKEPTVPTGTATLGLIANNYVRVYHPVAGNNPGLSGRCSAENASGSLSNLWIYAAILSTTHSFIVDNFNCGKELEDLNVYGAIAQNFRGPVGTTGGTGYLKNYNYDGRLAVDEPPYFLSPLNAGWQVSRETSPTAG
jgi:Tfp pilus assembly protein PilE